MRVRNDDRVRRRMRRNVVDMDMPMGMSALTIGQQICKFAG
jgi:hypothetical protein